MKRAILHFSIFFALLFFTNCGLDVIEKPYLTIVNRSPELNSFNADPWGPYFVVFNQKITISNDSSFDHSFSPVFSISAETLFISRNSGLPAFNSLTSIKNLVLVNADGESEVVPNILSFYSGIGESEDNSSPYTSDTLTNGIIYGKIDGSSSGVDTDLFLIPSTMDSIRTVEIKILNDIPLYCTLNNSSLVNKIDGYGSLPVTVKKGDQFFIRLSNEDIVSGLSRLQPSSKYKIILNKVG